MKYRYKVVKGNNTSISLSKNSKFCISYPDEGNVCAIPDTIGIIYFDNLRNAISFLFSSFLIVFEDNILREILFSKHRENNPVAKIFKIIPLDEEKSIYKIYPSNQLDRFYSGEQISMSMSVNPPEGTMCCQRINIIKPVIWVTERTP